MNHSEWIHELFFKEWDCAIYPKKDAVVFDDKWYRSLDGSVEEWYNISLIIKSQSRDVRNLGHNSGERRCSTKKYHFWLTLTRNSHRRYKSNVKTKQTNGWCCFGPTAQINALFYCECVRNALTPAGSQRALRLQLHPVLNLPQRQHLINISRNPPGAYVG